MALWADGDAISPSNMNNQQLSALTVDGVVQFGPQVDDIEGTVRVRRDSTETSTSIVINVEHNFVGGADTGDKIAIFAGTAGRRTGAHTGSNTGIQGIGSQASLGSSLWVRGVEGRAFGTTTSGATAINAAALYAGLAGAAAPASADSAYGLFVVDVTSATSNWAIFTNDGLVRFGDSVSMVSSPNLPSVVSGQGFMYVSDIGTLFWVGGSGSSTTLGAA